MKDFLDALLPLSSAYQQRKQIQVDDSPNIFTLISDQYHKENMHTDLLHFFLQDNLLRNNFLTLIAEIAPDCRFNHDATITVLKNKGFIDISLLDEKNKQVIIIENKINGAVDQPRQLIRYFEYFENQGITVLGAVYLTLDGTKELCFGENWTLQERARVQSKLINLTAYGEGSKNLHDHWISPSIPLIHDVDLMSTIRQYRHLLQILTKNSMDTPSLAQFYEIIMDNPQYYQSAQAVNQMLKELPKYLVLQMKNEYQFAKVVFPEIWVYSASDALATVLQDCMLTPEFNLTIDVKSIPNGLQVEVFEREGKLSPENDPIQGILNQLPADHGFTWNEDKTRYMRQFKFPEEKVLVDEAIKNFVSVLQHRGQDMIR